MKIKDYIEQLKTPFVINGITFYLYDVNYCRDKERLEFALEELRLDTIGMSPKDVIEYYRKETENGNIHYWGTWMFIPTEEDEKDDAEDTSILFGVRMD